MHKRFLETDEPIHLYFGLSYAQYLVIARSVLQSMPIEWQRKFVELLDELDETIDWLPDEGCYRVMLCEEVEEFDEDEERYVTKWGKQLHDPLMDYDRGRRRIQYKKEND